MTWYLNPSTNKQEIHASLVARTVSRNNQKATKIKNLDLEMVMFFFYRRDTYNSIHVDQIDETHHMKSGINTPYIKEQLVNRKRKWEGKACDSDFFLYLPLNLKLYQ